MTASLDRHRQQIRFPEFGETQLDLLVFTGSPMGKGPLQGLENCLREIPAPRLRPAWCWSSAGDRASRRVEPRNWNTDKEGEMKCLGNQICGHFAVPWPHPLLLQCRRSWTPNLGEALSTTGQGYVHLFPELVSLGIR